MCQLQRALLEWFYSLLLAIYCMVVETPKCVYHKGALLERSFLNDVTSLLFHSSIQSWQMRSLPTLDPYVS